jgi:hypothetical protein
MSVRVSPLKTFGMMAEVVLPDSPGQSASRLSFVRAEIFGCQKYVCGHTNSLLA